MLLGVTCYLFGSIYVEMYFKLYTNKSHVEVENGKHLITKNYIVFKGTG